MECTLGQIYIEIDAFNKAFKRFGLEPSELTCYPDTWWKIEAEAKKLGGDVKLETVYVNDEWRTWIENLLVITDPRFPKDQILVT